MRTHFKNRVQVSKWNITEKDGSLSCGESNCHLNETTMKTFYTRVTYSPVSVLTRMVSPTFTNCGHITSSPVSVRTFLVTPVAVSPRMAVSASTTFRSTELGISTSS